jgi:hypothetical protein
MVSLIPRPFCLRGRALAAHCIGGWVGPRASLDSVTRKNNPSPCQESNPDLSVCSIVTVLTEMYHGCSWRRIHYVTKHHDIKTYFGCGGIDPRILNFSTRWNRGSLSVLTVTDSVIVKAKVKLALCFYWAPRHEGVLGSGGKALRILDLDTRWKWVVSFTPRSFYPQGNSSWYPLDRRLCGPQIQICERWIGRVTEGSYSGIF